ncbi:hypothetical protein RYX36_030351 [Vicia faba]
MIFLENEFSLIFCVLTNTHMIEGCVLLVSFILSYSSLCHSLTFARATTQHKNRKKKSEKSVLLSVGAFFAYSFKWVIVSICFVCGYGFLVGSLVVLYHQRLLSASVLSCVAQGFYQCLFWITLLYFFFFLKESFVDSFVSQ